MPRAPRRFTAKSSGCACFLNTVLGWDVEDIAATAQRLSVAGVDFERYA